MSPRSQFTETQIKRVLTLYSTVSTTAAYDLGKTCGMKPSRVRQFAYRRGIKAKLGDNCRWKPTRDIHNDTRWARAIAIGPVLA